MNKISSNGNFPSPTLLSSSSTYLDRESQKEALLSLLNYFDSVFTAKQPSTTFVIYMFDGRGKGMRARGKVLYGNFRWEKFTKCFSFLFPLRSVFTCAWEEGVE
jgi:hypothetical protein